MTGTLDILDKLIGFDTTSAKSNLAMVGFVEDLLKAQGFAVQRLTDPDEEKMGLYAEIGPSGDGVLLSAHSDVVPAEGQVWSRQPFRMSREDDRVYGRGTTDMKGFVASMLALAERASAVRLREPLKLVLSYDEEIGCVGLQRMLDRLAPMIGQPRACVVGEPTEMKVALGHKGKAALKAVCQGDAGHSALAPKFANALYMASDFIQELRRLQSDAAKSGPRDAAYDVPYTTYHVGVLTGGRALNIVPDRAELTFEYRHLAADPAKEIFRRIKQAADAVTAEYRKISANAEVAVEQFNAYPGLDVQDTDAIVAYAKGLAQTDDVTKVAFGTEAGFFAELGVPTVVCGPGSMEGQGHKPDEYISLGQLSACDAMMDRLLDDLKQ